MRIAATADIHFSPQNYDRIREPMARVRDEADMLVIAGDLTNYGTLEEMHSLLNGLVRLRIPIVAVLGNHDYESGQETELIRMMTTEGIKVLDGSSYERDGVGFAGAKGFLGGFGRGMLTAFGEKEVKAFVQTGLDETLKLERALSMLRTPKIVIVTHYAPICETVEGERPEIWPYLGSSRLAEVIDRHQATVAFHGHAHHGKLDGKTIGGVPVHNVALSLLMAQDPPCPYRVVEV
jgi:Icc-related predicted phosphoesterase